MTNQKIWRRVGLGAPVCAALFYTLLGAFSITRAWADRDKPWPPAPEFTIVQKEIPVDDEPLAKEYSKHVEYALKIENQEEGIFLARAYHGDSAMYRTLGFDSESFKLVALAPDVLLHATWSTARQGNGANTCESDLLLAKTNGIWTEVFRDTHDGYSKAGLAHTRSTKLRFSFDAESRAMIVEKSITTFDYWEGEPHLFGRQVAIGTEEANKDAPVYASQTSLVEEWPCTLGDGELKWGAGSRHLTLGSGPFKLQNVVRFLKTGSNIEELAALDDETLSTRIRALNPHFGTSDMCWGIIRFGIDVPRYVENRGHLYWMSNI